MKFIHCADIHLGSKMESKLPNEKSEERKAEVRETFRFIVEYARKNDVRAILLSGDVFDSDVPFKKDKDYFFNIVKNFPDIDFLYLRGNHDKEKTYETECQNLKTFSSEWTRYEYGDVTVSGIESTNENVYSAYPSLSLPANSFNVVMMHGETGNEQGLYKVDLSSLRNKNIDYLALGHYHTHEGFSKLDERGFYAYSGCPEGRGFDEAGKKGFVLVDTESDEKFRFIPCAKREIVIENVDITGTQDDFGAYTVVKETVGVRKRDIVRIVLKGEVGFDSSDLKQQIEEHAKNDYYFVNVKNKTTQKIDLTEFENSTSLRAEFIRAVRESDLSDEEKAKIVATGLIALKVENEL